LSPRGFARYTHKRTQGHNSKYGYVVETNVKAIELKDLWKKYKNSGDQRARERLVVAYSQSKQKRKSSKTINTIIFIYLKNTYNTIQ